MKKIIIILLVVCICVFVYYLFKNYKENSEYPKNKILLCCPINGLNDTFVQILKCYNYCVTNNRTLFINTKVNYKQSMNYNFYDFFIFRNTNLNIIYDTNKINEIFKNNKFSVFKNLDKYLNSNYTEPEMQYIKSVTPNILYDNEKNISLTFDFNKKYNENILLHMQGGGGDGYKLFNYIDINNKIKNILKLKLDVLSNNYISIYIRNTDIKSDYKTLFNKNEKIIKNNNNTIFLATDSKEVVDYFKKKNKNIYNFSSFPKNKYYNLHNSDINTNTKVTDSIIDLYLLGLSKSIISNSNSGFYKLAKHLNLNKRLINLNNIN